MATKIVINNGSDNGLLSDVTKPLPEPMLSPDCWYPSYCSFTEIVQDMLETNHDLEVTLLKIFMHLPGNNEFIFLCHDIFWNKCADDMPSYALPLFVARQSTKYKRDGMMLHKVNTCTCINSSPPGQNGRHFTDNIFRCIFVNEKLYILIKILLKFVPKGPIDNNPALV